MVYSKLEITSYLIGELIGELANHLIKQLIENSTIQ